ncbi:MAG: hypothetical protein AAF711_01075 [Planctomycetota bacterium]
MSKAFAMTKETLIEQLTGAIRSLVDRYKAQKSEAALKVEAEQAKLEKLRDELGEDSPAYAGLEKVIAGLGYDPGADEKRRLQEASLALVAAANAVGLKVALRKVAGRSGSGSTSGGTRTRMSSAALEEASEKIHKVLPPANTGDDNCKPIGAIAEESGFDPAVVRSALSKLKRDGWAESNGRRGQAGGWRKAAA